MTPLNSLVAPVGGSRLLPVAIPRARRALLASVLLVLGSLPVLNAATATPQVVPAILEDSVGVAVTLAGTVTGTGTLTFTLATQPSKGVLTGTLPNLTYTPSKDANGADKFTFTATDSVGVSAPAEVTISITAVNDAPVAVIPVVDTLAGVNWFSQSASGSRAWQAIASSADGLKLVAAVDNGAIYTSADGGAAWTESVVVSAGVNRNWQAVASSADGSKLVAAVDGGQIYTSTDSGSTWAPRSSDSTSSTVTRNWKSVASSADGLKLVAAEYGGKIYSSADAGVTWTARESARPWYAVASSSDGAKLTAVVYGGGIYTSTDSGATWVLKSTGSKLWTAVASSANGSKLAAVEVNGFISTSADAGATWTEQAGSGARFWTSLAATADGTELVASTYGGKLYTSADSGVTWTARNSDRLWFAVAASADGGRLAAVTDGGLIYTSQDVNEPATITIAEDSGAYSNANLFTTLSKGPSDEASQTLTVSVSNDKPTLFLVQPAISAAGVLTFTPAANANGDAVITIASVTDSAGASSVPTPRNTIRVAVTPVNDAPTQGAVAVSGTEDTSVSFTSTAFSASYNVGHPDIPVRAAVIYTIETLPTSGTLKLSGTAVAVGQVIPVANLANLAYEPALNESGAKTFRVSVSDGGLSSAKGAEGALVTVTLGAANDAPTAVAQSVITLEDTAVAIVLTGTDSDVGNTLTATVMSQPTKGTLSGTVPNITYTPNLNFSGSDSFTFKVNDGTVDSGVETVTISVVAVNDAPVLGAVAVAGLEDTIVSFTSALFSTQYSDLESNTFTSLTVTTLPASGSLKLAGAAVTVGQVILVADLGGLTYVPALNENGVKTFTVRASDGSALSVPTTVTVVLGGVNDAPSLAAVSKSANEDATLTFAMSDFYTGTPATSKFSDPDLSALSKIKIVSLPTAGTLKNSGAAVAVGLELAAGQIGQLTYSRLANENGDATFTVSGSDGDLWSDAAVVTVSLTAVNDAPSATIPTTTLVPAGTTLASVGGIVAPGTANYKAVASSQDASKLAAVVDGGQIYVSADSGVTWTAKPVDQQQSAKNWSDIAISTDGQVLAASEFRGKIWVSINGGTTWTARDDNRTWRSVAASSTGVVIAAVANGGQVYVSVDSGATWTARASAQLWTSVAVSADGNRMLASVYGGSLYTSVDKGTTWTAVATSRLWNSVASSLDGMKLAATEAQGSVWSSIDGGVTWTANTSAGSRNWSSVAISADGSRLLAAVSGGKLQLSLDAGVSWKELSSSANYSSVVGSSDLKKVIVAVDGGGLFTSADYTIALTITVDEDSGKYTQSGFATAASAGPSNESSQKISYVVALNTGGASLFAEAPTISENGTLSFVPAANATGTATLTVSVKDDGGVLNGGVDTAVANSGSGSFTVVISPVDDAPTATAQAVAVTEDTAKAFTLAGVDPEGVSLTYEVVTQPTKGTLSGTAPNLTYTPTLNATGADSFTFKVKDASVSSATAAVSITIANVNDAPVVADQSVTTNEDTAKSITLVGTDVDGDTLTYSVVTQPTKGTLSGTGSALVYTPTANLNGADTFTFKVNDGTVNSAVATVTIGITAVNDIPLASNQAVAVLEDAANGVNFTLTGSSPEGRVITYAVLTLPTKGTLSGTAPALRYTPSANTIGTDSFTFKVNDGLDNSGVATVTLTIANVNDAPSFVIPTTVKPGGEKSDWTKLSAANASWNSLSASADGAVVVATSGSSLVVSTDGGVTSAAAATVGGSGNFNAAAVSSDGTKIVAARGTLLYRSANNGSAWSSLNIPAAAAGYVSVASSADGLALVAVSANSKIQVSADSGTTWSAVGSAQNWKAVASSSDGAKLAAAAYNGLIYTSTDSGKTWTARGSVSRNWTAIASGEDGTTLAATEVNGQIYTSSDSGVTWTARESARAWSSVSVSGDGKLILAGVLGGKLYYSDDFGVTWSAKDQDRVWSAVAIAGDGGNALAAVLDGPLYRAAGYVTEYVVTAEEDTATTVAKFAKDMSAGPTHESAQLVSFVLTSDKPEMFSEGPAISSSGELTFTPASDAVGTALVSVYAKDNGGTTDGGVDSSAARTFKITVSGVNDAPVAGSQVVTALEDTAKAITLNGFDAEGTALTYTLVRQPTKGTLSGTAPNLTYTPAANVSGADNFTFKVSDGTLESGPGTVSITVASVNDAPVASNQSAAASEDDAQAIVLNAADVDGDKLTYTVLTAPTKGELFGTAPNLIYVPNPEVSGTDSFTYKVSDGTLESTVVTVSITVASVNDAPVAGTQSVKTDEDTAAMITLTGFDPEGATLTYKVVSQPANGVVSGEGASLEYMPNPDFNGKDSFTYKVSDGSLDSSPVTVAIMVASIPDGPVALTQTVKAVQGNSAAVTLKAYDGDKDTLTYTLASQPKLGTLSGTAPNLVYKANADAKGTDSITFRVNDGTSDSGLATVLIVIGESSKLSIKSSSAEILKLEVRAPKGAVVQIENTTKLGAWSATAIKVTGEGTDVGVPVNLQVDKNVPARFWRLNVLSMP